MSEEGREEGAPIDEGAPDAPDPPARLGRRLAVGVFLGLVVYAGLVLFADAEETLSALREFPLRLLPVAVALSFANYLVRFPRWERYRGLLGIRMTRGTSLLVYLSGLALTVSPGKMGEVFKSWLIRRVDGTPLSRSAPIVLAERFTDLVGFLLLIAIGGLFVQTDYAWVFWCTLAACFVALVLVGSARVQERLLRALHASPLPTRLVELVDTGLSSTRLLLRPRELPLAVGLAALGWGLEGVGFTLLAGAFGPQPSLAFCVTTFSLSAVAGAVLIIFPGGLGITEGLLGTLLEGRYVRTFGMATELARPRAASVVLLFRFATLWFAVGLGFVALLLFEWRFKRRARLAAADPR